MLDLFEENNWNELDFMLRDWSKHLDYDDYFLGSTKHNDGYPLNCKGVKIHTEYGNIRIAHFDEEGEYTLPLIWITKDKF